MQNIILVCFDIVLLWIIVIIETCDKHAYTEDNVEIRQSSACRAVVNHTVELTEEEKTEARRQAVRQYQEEEIRKMKERKSKSAVKVQENKQTEPNLFGF